MKPIILFAVLVLAPIGIATASIVNVTNNSQVNLATNDNLLFYISIDDFSFGQAPGYPGGIQILLGGMPIGGPVAPIPGTSGVYMPGIEFSGTLQSQDGSIRSPLSDSNATHLGLPDGYMLLTPGSHSGGSYSGPIDLLSAEVTISSPEAAGLFASGEVVIALHNIGTPIAFGYPGSPIASDFTASWISSDGSQSKGAQIRQVDCVQTPEPGTIGLLLIGLTIVCARFGKMRAARLTLCPIARTCGSEPIRRP